MKQLISSLKVEEKFFSLFDHTPEEPKESGVVNIKIIDGRWTFNSKIMYDCTLQIQNIVTEFIKEVILYEDLYTHKGEQPVIVQSTVTLKERASYIKETFNHKFKAKKIPSIPNTTLKFDGVDTQSTKTYLDLIFERKAS